MGSEISYYCPSCGNSVWAYSGFQGNTCWGCKLFKPMVNKGGWYDLMKKRGIKLQKNLSQYYQSDQTIHISLTSETLIFKNVLPKSSWQLSDSYTKISDTYTCGLNAINLAKAMWGYKSQMEKSQYCYNGFVNLKWGMSGSQFYDYNVDPAFKYSGYTYQQSLLMGGVDFKWNYIDGTDYQIYSLIALGGYGLGAHYFLIIGVDQNKKYFLITDQTKWVWVLDVKLMRTACIYSYNGYTQHSLYKVG